MRVVAQCTAPALSARTVCTRGRGGAYESEVGGQTASIQGKTEGAKRNQEGREDKGSDEIKDNKDQGNEEENSKSASSEESKTEEPSKPPAKTQASTKTSQDNVNEGKEGTADDDDDDDLFPCDVEACCKGHKKGGCLRKGPTGERRSGFLASQTARAVGDFGTPWNRKH